MGSRACESLGTTTDSAAIDLLLGGFRTGTAIPQASGGMCPGQQRVPLPADLANVSAAMWRGDRLRGVVCSGSAEDPLLQLAAGVREQHQPG